MAMNFELPSIYERDGWESKLLSKRDCVQCPPATPSCPSCPSGQHCVQTSLNCTSCAQAYCAIAPNSGGSSSTNGASSVLPGVLGGVLGVAVVCIAGYGFFRYKSRRSAGRPFFRDNKNRLGSVDYDAQAKSSVASHYRSDHNSQQFIPDNGPQYQPSRGLQPPQADVYRPQSYTSKSIHSLATLKTRQSQGSTIIPIALDSDAASVGDSSYIHPSTASVSSFVSRPRSEDDDEMSPSSNYNHNHLSTFTDGGMSMRLSDYNPSIISPTSVNSPGSLGANVHQAVRAKPALIKVDSIRSPPGTAAGGNRRPVIVRNISTNDSSHPLSTEAASNPLDKEAMESPVLSPDTNAILTHQNNSLTSAFRPESRDTDKSSISQQESTISIENPFSDPVWGEAAPDVNLEAGMSRRQSTLSELPRGSMASSLPRGLRSSAGSSVFQGDRHLSHTSSIWSNPIPSPGTAPPVPSVPTGFLDSPNADSPIRNSRNSEIPIFFGRDGDEGEEKR